jgi:hypothetical protein
MKTIIHHLDLTLVKLNQFSINCRKSFAIKAFLVAVLSGLPSAISVRADALTGLYTQVAVGDPDFGGGSNAGGTLTTGLVQNQLGPNGLPVLSASGISQLGTNSDMNPTTHELLWWSAGADPYVSLDSNPVQTDSMPLNYGYPNPWYPTGQTSDQNFYRTVQWQGTFTMATAGSINLYLQVDDDAWLFIDGTLVAEDHYGYTSNTSTPMALGTHSINLFYDDRFPSYDSVIFSSSVPLSPVPEPSIITLFISGAILLLTSKARRALTNKDQ